MNRRSMDIIRELLGVGGDATLATLAERFEVSVLRAAYTDAGTAAAMFSRCHQVAGESTNAQVTEGLCHSTPSSGGPAEQ